MRRAQKVTLQHSTSQNWLSVQISSVIPVGDADLGLTDTSKSSLVVSGPWVYLPPACPLSYPGNKLPLQTQDPWISRSGYVGSLQFAVYQRS